MTDKEKIEALRADLAQARDLAHKLQDALGSRNAPVASADAVVLANRLGNKIGAMIENIDMQAA